VDGVAETEYRSTGKQLKCKDEHSANLPDVVALPSGAFVQFYTNALRPRLVKDGVQKALRDRQLALAELVHAIREYRRTAYPPMMKIATS